MQASGLEETDKKLHSLPTKTSISIPIPVSIPKNSSFDSNLHEHEDGTVHSHPHDGEHTHDDELPDFTKMTKKVLDEWAESQGIMLDRRKTKAHMLEELKGKLN